METILYVSGVIAVLMGVGYVWPKKSPSPEPILLLEELLPEPEEIPEEVPEEIEIEEPEEVEEVEIVEPEPEPEPEPVVIDWGNVPPIDRVNFHIRRFTMALEQNQDEALTEDLSRNLRYWSAVKVAIEIGQG